MKKLLTLLGSVSLVATTTQMAVACGTNYDKKDEYGNSILIEFLKSIDGTASISSSDILWKLINNQNGPQNKEKLTLDLLKMINLSILANTTSKKNDFNDKSIYANYDLANILSERWKSLSATVDRQITTEKDKYKKDYGKKWEKKWKEMLVEKYSVYQDDVKSMDLDFLENKYKANILLTDSNNSASKALLDVLLNTNQQGVTWIGVNDIFKKQKALTNIVNSNDDTKIANYVKADLDQIAQIKNSTKEASEWKSTTLTETSSTKELVEAAKDVVKITIDKIVYDTPVNLNNFTLNDTNNSRAGFLSNSQKYFLDKFYTTQAPLAISEVVIPFSENGSFDNGVTVNSFKSNDGIDQKNTNQLLSDIATDDNGSEWRRWMVEGKAANHTKATVKHYDKLMTLSNSTDFTQDMRSVVYDFVLDDQKINGKAYPDGNTFAEENDGILGTIISDISRAKDNEKFYLYNADLGRVYYVDSTGLHIVQIDGYSYFKGKEQVSGKAIKGLSLNGDKTQIESETLEELNAFKKYNSLIAEEKVNELQTNIDSEEGGTYKELNDTIVNPYLKYLTNSSMLKGISGSASGFDIMSEVKDWAQISSSTESASYWMTSVFDYFRTVSTTKDQNEFIKKYIEFQTDDGNKQNESIEKTEKWFYSSVETKQSLNAINPSIFYTESFDKWTEEIRTKTDASNYPKQEIKFNYRENIVTIANTKFWMPKDNSENISYLNNFVYSNKTKSYIVLNFGQITNEIQNSYITFKNGGTK